MHGDAPRLGVGIMVNPALAPFLARTGAVDYLAVTPDMCWIDRGRPLPAADRFVDSPAWIRLLQAAGLPMVSHHIGLSLASAVPTDEAYVYQIARWADRWSAAWTSEHLAFVTVDDAAGANAAGLALTAPFDDDVLDLVVERALRIRERTGRPFLLENSAYYVTFDDADMDEAEFLNRFCARSGCGLLLDLHNLYCNAVNHGFSAHGFLRALDLSRVVEVHIAGGAMMAGMYTDSHAGAPPEPVWDLLDDLLDRAPGVRGVTFEFHDSYLPTLGEDGCAAVIARARALWRAHA